MAGTMSVHIREMTIDDYEKVYGLWMQIQGFGIRSIDDSREGVERFLKRNPTTSVVAEQNGRIEMCIRDRCRKSGYPFCTPFSH